MQIIKEHVVKGDIAILDNGVKIHGPVEDADAFLRAMGAETDVEAYGAADPYDRHGDWEFHKAPEAGQGFGGPYVIKPEGWNDEGDNDGLNLRIFSTENILPPFDLQCTACSGCFKTSAQDGSKCA